MKTIIAGCRWLTNPIILDHAIAECPWSDRISEVVGGRASGVDRLGEAWAKKHHIRFTAFPAGWRNADGTRNLGAGHQRNERMARYADGLIAVWDGLSGGTEDMIERAQAHGLRVFVYRFM